MQYKAAFDGGADGIDLAMVSMSGGTSQPDTTPMQVMPFGTGIWI